VKTKLNAFFILLFLNQMEGTETTTFTAEQMETAKQEALNKYKSDQEAGVQKLIQEKKMAEEVLDAVGEVAQDQKKLISIFDAKPEVAKKILDKYYGGKTIEEYKESIWFEEDPKLMNERMVEEKAKSIVNQNRIQDTKKAFIEKTWLEGDDLKAFEEEFDDRLGLKSFTIDKLDEHLTKAFKLATGYTEDKIKEIQKAKAIASVAGMNGSDKVNESNKSRIKSEVDDLLNGRI
jgi:hypothetical protein